LKVKLKASEPVFISCLWTLYLAETPAYRRFVIAVAAGVAAGAGVAAVVLVALSILLDAVLATAQ